MHSIFFTRWGNSLGVFHMIFLKNTRTLKQFLQLQPFEWNVWVCFFKIITTLKNKGSKGIRFSVQIWKILSIVLCKLFEDTQMSADVS